MDKKALFKAEEETLKISLGNIELTGDLVIPETAGALIIIPDASSNIKYSYRLHYFAHLLREAGLATILINLLTAEEENLDCRSQHFRCDIRYLATRLVEITDYLSLHPITQHLQIGYFAANENGSAAILAASERPQQVGAVVSRGGKTDLCSSTLPYLQTPTLLIVGGDDYPTRIMNEDAFLQIGTEDKKLEIIAKATHQFQEPGALEEVARLANQWFHFYLSNNNCDRRNLHPISTTGLSPNTLDLSMG